MTLLEAQAFVEEMSAVTTFIPGDWIQLAIAEPESDQVLGDIGLFLEANESAAELGFTLCREAHRRGHATRAARGAVSLAFAATRAREVRAVTDVRNRDSIRVLERASFTRLHARETVFKGEPCSEVVYAYRRADA
jgi:RimJ/RimL family protein N-acetyltransferase